MGEKPPESQLQSYRDTGHSGEGVDFPIKCNWMDCKEEMWFGERLLSIFNHEKDRFDYYCHDHYLTALENKYLGLYNSWKDRIPTDEFRNIFARYVAELYGETGLPEALTKGKLENRIVLRKYKYGVEFIITRHMNAFSEHKPMEIVEQTWRFYNKRKKLKKVREH